MLNQLKQEANMTFTENGAVTHRSTMSDCLDLFATIGALRRESAAEIKDRFLRAFAEDRDVAMKLLFYARDVRGGLGERRVFRTILEWLAHNYPESVKKNLEYIAEFGRFDDLMTLIGTPCEGEMLEVIRRQLEDDKKAMENGEAVSLLAKWLPSVNASNATTVRNAKKVARSLGMKDAEYRKLLVALRAYLKIVENNLRQKDYTFDYSCQPAKAMYKYRNAFIRNDSERYRNFIDQVSLGEKKLNTSTLAPYELVEPYLTKTTYMKDQVSPEEIAVLNATWDSLPDFCGDENALAVIDTSGSMYFDAAPLPAAVSLSLGLYCAERNKGIFKNHFIQFSATPQLIEIKGDTFFDRLRYAMSFSEIANTNVEAVFDLILRTAVKHNVPQNELPSKLIIISDMEFDCCVNGASETNFARAKRMFEQAGYRLPEVVFWNVASRHRQQPVTMNEQGVALVSGCTPKLFSMVAGGIATPYEFMMEVIQSERYEKIVA